MTLTVDLPPSVDEAHARLLLAIGLFQEDVLTVGRAAEMAGLTSRAFVEELYARRIPPYPYDDDDDDDAFEHEMETVRQLVRDLKERDA